MPQAMYPCQNKIALVTGASRGIGASCALALAKAGATVIAVARSETLLVNMAQQLSEQAESGKIIPWVMDVTSEAFLDRIGTLTKLDILVNNAGTNIPEPFTEVSLENLERIIALNITAVFRCSQAAVKIMMQHNGGSIIHISSQMGHVGSPNRSAYCMSKHAMEGLNRAMAVELAPSNIRVNTVAPTFVITELTRPMLDDPEFNRFVLENIPMGKLARSEDVANAVLFLASDASSMITGDSLKIDGGWTAK